MTPQQPNNNTNPTRGITANDLVVGGKYVPHSKSIGCLSLEEIKRKMSKIEDNFVNKL